MQCMLGRRMKRGMGVAQCRGGSRLVHVGNTRAAAEHRLLPTSPLHAFACCVHLAKTLSFTERQQTGCTHHRLSGIKTIKGERTELVRARERSSNTRFDRIGAQRQIMFFAGTWKRAVHSN
ncbi:unnamed protein product [Pleuronectes platessa]|uniref:Uncharacterized protein n=1 Tax=Pleuronectes platessa TaxID=8262 RepID=A0A9N7UMS2_PLEPL|nr:unnamed protein product [Pleuronectes platessa]